ncbi:MAG TPA: GNAT family protein [Symbiobacteriaceae bacterium]|nr:GNAT family protein [Symbiobacteriaceae bacterium]
MLGPITLNGSHIRLEPLRPHHFAGLLSAGQNESIFTHLSAPLNTPEAIDSFIMAALSAEVKGEEYAFAVVRQSDGVVLGSTRFMDVVEPQKNVEIGWTWYMQEVWGTAVNPEAKYLLLCHAFDTWGAKRVCWKTDERNVRSQAAIKKLGAQYEGAFRNHRRRRDGSWRNTVYFSVIDAEWPGVKTGLETRLAGYGE